MNTDKQFRVITIFGLAGLLIVCFFAWKVATVNTDPYFNEKAYYVAFNTKTQTFSIVAPSRVVKTRRYLGSYADSLDAVNAIPPMVRRIRRLYGLSEE